MRIYFPFTAGSLVSMKSAIFLPACSISLNKGRHDYFISPSVHFKKSKSSLLSTSQSHQKVIPDYGSPSFGITRKLPGVAFEKAVEDTRLALKKVGFGVITEIDMKATIQNKLNEEIKPYIIFGACQPTLAYGALQVMPSVGLLLPCNVVVSVDSDGSFVSAVDPVALFSLVDSKELKPVAEQVQALIKTAIYSI